MEFVADGTVFVSDLQLQAMWVNEGLAKLETYVMAEVFDWVDESDLYKWYINWLKAFYKIKNNASDFHQQHLAIRLELMATICIMQSTISKKLDHLHENLACYINAIGQNNNNK